MYKQNAKQISSIFMKHFNDLMTITDIGSLKAKVQEIVSQSNINTIDKKKIQIDVAPLQDLRSMQFYLTNSMLKYSGMGVR
jgi:hypothetical protein